jgi:hypothetical protein
VWISCSLSITDGSAQSGDFICKFLDQEQRQAVEVGVVLGTSKVGSFRFY